MQKNKRIKVMLAWMLSLLMICGNVNYVDATVSDGACSMLETPVEGTQEGDDISNGDVSEGDVSGGNVSDGDVSQGEVLQDAATVTVLYSGTIYGVIWEITSDGILYIKGKNYSNDEGGLYKEWQDYGDYYTKVVVTAENVKSTRGWFYCCENITEVDLSNFDASNVFTMSYMFYGCTALEKIHMKGLDTSKVKDMSRMFLDCTSLTKLDLRGFDTSSVTNMSYMFWSCDGLSDLNVSKFDTSNVTNMADMFCGCSRLSDLNVSNFDTSNVTNMSYMFYGCSGLKKLNLLNFNTANVEEMNDMFGNCSGLTTLDLSSFDTSKVDQMDGMFAGCWGLKKLDLSHFVTDSVYDMSQMFQDCWNLSTLDISGFCTSKVNNMSSMFEKCYSIKTLDLSGFDTSRVREMWRMFWGCDSLQQLNVSSFNTAKVTDMYSMFEYCSQLEVLDLSSFNTSKVTDMSRMFINCPKLKTLDISGFDFASIDQENGLQKMFGSGTKLSFVKCPANLQIDVKMPYTVMYDVEAGEYSTYFPKGLSEGIWLYAANPKGAGSLWVEEIEPQVYTGKAIKPVIKVYNGTELLKEKVDYTLSFKNNTKVNDASVEKTAPTITVKGKGKFTKTDVVTFQILAKDISAGDITVNELTAVAGKKVQKPVPVLKYNGKKLVNKKDFEVSYPDLEDENKPDAYKAPGTYRILVTGKGNFTGERELLFVITGGTLMNKTKIASIAKQEYTGSKIEPKLKVTYKGKTLEEGTDYTLSYENNVEIGKATVTVTGIGNYAGTKTAYFQIIGQSIAKAKVTGIVDKTYNGTEQTQEIVVALGQQDPLVCGRDYKVTYTNNINAGKATILIEGIGGYSGKLKKTFKINAYDLAKDTEKLLQGMPESLQVSYCKGGATPVPDLVFNGTELAVKKDYSIQYSNNKKVTSADKSAWMTIKGKGNFKGSVKIPFTIVAKDLQDAEHPVTITVEDAVISQKKGNYISKPVLMDSNGKKLVAGVDYEKDVVYTLEDGTVLDKNDTIETEQIIRVTVKGKNQYQGEIQATYRMVWLSVHNARIIIPPQIYTGDEVTVEESEFRLTLGNWGFQPPEYYCEVVEGSYQNNVNPGTASVLIRGIDDWGGTQRVSFKIVPKEVEWFWRIIQ